MGYNPNGQLPMPPPLPPQHHGVYPGDAPLPGHLQPAYPGAVHYGSQPPAPPKLAGGPPGPPQGLAPQGFGSRLPQPLGPPPVESVPGRRKETEEERNERKKREYYEKKRQQEKLREREREREKGHQVRPGAGGSKPVVNGSRDAYGDKKVAVGGGEKVENRLKRPSTFLCKIK